MDNYNNILKGLLSGKFIRTSYNYPGINPSVNNFANAFKSLHGII